MPSFNGFGEDVIKSICSDIFVKGISNYGRFVDVTLYFPDSVFNKIIQYNLTNRMPHMLHHSRNEP